MSGFEACFGAVIGHEGGFTDNPADAGNWTGGRQGAGICRGTNWGISAAAFPTLDIQELTLEQARDIYRVRYWAPLCADQLAGGLALLVFDAAVNAGTGRAVRWLQASCGAAQDGLVGPMTLAAVAAAIERDGLNAVCTEFQARRLLFMAALAGWATFGGGWARRICRLPYQAMALTSATAASS